MASRRRCPVCGSKQWHKGPSSGLIACSEGHILQNYRNETNEAEDMGNHMMRKRTLKSNRKKRERESKANPKLYHGSRGRYLYFQCQQLILRKQIAALTKLWKLPSEFEMVCRDLWTLRLSLLPDPPPSEPRFEESAARFTDREKDEAPLEFEQRYHRSRSRSRSRTTTSRPQTPETRPISPLPSDSPSSSSSSDEDDSEKDRDPHDGGQSDWDRDDNADEEDSELAQLMRENSESDDDDNEGKRSLANTGERKRKRGHNVYEGPTNNIAVLVVACWTLRIPVMYGDFTRLIELYELPYLDPVRLLPRDMVSHLTKHNEQALSPAHAPKTLTVHALTSRLAKQLFNSYKILTPEANAAPILWRVIQGMGGTPAVYMMTKRLSRMLSLPLALHQSLVPGLRQIKARDPGKHKFDNAPVEASLVAAAIVVLKMVYGLNGERRSPKDSGDPAHALPCPEDYLELVRQLGDPDSTREAAFNSEQPVSIDALDDNMLDQYLAFCERVLLRPAEDEPEDDEKILTNYFSLSRHNHATERRESRIPTTVRRSHMELGETDTNVPRPGEEYTIYHASDMFGTVPLEYEIVVRRGSELVGVPEEYLYGLVETMERRVNRGWKRG